MKTKQNKKNPKSLQIRGLNCVSLKVSEDTQTIRFLLKREAFMLLKRLRGACLGG
jgi:hypothetical protein